MGYWENTAYVNDGNSSAVTEALIALFANEGMRLIPAPPERKRAWYEPMQYATALQNNLWGLAVFPGAGGWTVIKTAPLELLGERAPGAGRMRLVELASRLRVGALLYNVYDSNPALLTETDGRGDYRLSGYVHESSNNPNPLEYYGETLSEDRLEPRFELLPLQSCVDASHYDLHSADAALAAKLATYVDADKLARRLAMVLGGPNARWCDNGTSVDLLVCHKRLPIEGADVLYFDWPGHDRPDEGPRSRLDRSL
jgi:hypothetical protein